MSAVTWGLRFGAVAALATVAAMSCAPESGTQETVSATEATVESSASALRSSPEAHARIDALRARFRIKPMARPDAHLHPGETVPEPTAVLGASVATGFDRIEAERVRPVIPAAAKRSVLRSASVELPARASGAVHLEDDTTHVAISFTLEGATEAPIDVAEGIARYAGAWRGSDVIHRADGEGTEDFVVLEEKPEEEALRYEVDVERVAGLRLVSNVLEFLDEGGAPRLRMRPPYVVDAAGVRSEARIAVEGCAYDTDPSGPWGRPVTKAGAAECGVRLSWRGVKYPAMVDPAWVATGSMTTQRVQHSAVLLNSGKVLLLAGTGLTTAELYDAGAGTFAATGSMTTQRTNCTATLLPSGKVLVTGGYGSTYLASAELFDGIGTFTATGSMTAARVYHTATLLNSGKVLITGGQSSGGTLASAELFDGTSTFTPTGSMTGARQDHTAVRLPSGKVLLAGGYGGGTNDLASAELFDGTSTFTATGSMSTARRYHTATLLPSGKVLIAGGADVFNTFASAEIFDGTSAFTTTAPMAVKRDRPLSSVLPSGKVLVLGGDGTMKSTDLFDGTSTFKVGAPTINPRTYASATQLPSGKVLVAGGGYYGTGGIFNGSATAEIYDPKPNGAQCSAPTDCVSGVCDDGICCSGPCNGVCQTCLAGTGACVAVTNAPDPGTCTGSTACDAIGACKAVLGQACAAGAACVSGFCADDVCCDTACAGACDACKQAGKIGTCTPLPAGNAGNPACTSNLCDGTSATCPTSCTTDSNCTATYYCAADGTCQPRKPQGMACDQTADCKVAGCRDCATGYCTDGFCCDTACKGAGHTCQACAAALKASGTGDGTCGPALNHTDPHDDCLPDPNYPGNCKADGMCDGTGSCRTIAAQGTICGSATCTNGIVTGGACDALGNCSGGMSSCGLYACNAMGNGCNTSCVVDADCGTTAFCDTATSTCVLKGSIGGPCTTGLECSSGHCFDGVCCDKACDGICEACNFAAKKGTCLPIMGDPTVHGHPACPGDAECGGSCDGADTSICHFPGAGTPCGKKATCTGDVATAAQACDGSGTCAPAATKNCPPYACDLSSGECKQSCTTNADCAQGAACDTTTNKCAPAAATCEDAFTAKAPDGTLTPCTPYRCKSGACQSSCAVDADCADGYGCNGGMCEQQAGTGGAGTGGTGGGSDTSTPASKGGCGCRTAPSDDGRSAWLLTLLPLLAARRRRRAA